MSNDWRRQKVQDHKFDFIDVEDYVDNSPWRNFKYSLVFAIVIKGILIYCADLWTAVNLLVAGNWNTNLAVEGGQIQYGGISISFEIYKWIFAVCIILSFILLAWDMKKAYYIIQSRDISYAFTSMIAYRYYAIKSYAHFCLFEKIHNSKKTMDEVAFFCFFTFRGWKRLMFADGPRQVINGIILITVITKNSPNNNVNLAFWNYNFPIMTRVTMGLMTFTLTLWVISVLLMLVAVCLYIPLVIEIKGNLKEFCCHKIDKRIDEIVKKKAKERSAEAAKNQKNGKGGDTPLQKPTLPNIGLFDEGGRSSPVPGGTPRLAAQSPYMGSPALRKAMPAPNDPYRRQYPQQPARPYSPAPRPYSPSLDDDGDTKPLRQDNHAQHYHNHNIRRQDQQYDFADNQSEISDGAYSARGGYQLSQYPPKVQVHAHRRQPSDTSTVLSGSNQGSVVSGYGPRAGKPHPLQHGQMMSREAGLGNSNKYADTVMLADMSNHRGAPGPYGGYQGPPTGLGGGVNSNPNGSMVGSSINGSGYVDQQRGRYQQAPQAPHHQHRPYN
ncbi:hypothetical protein BGZ99_010251 [Dissophora globulifera]|uniref:Vacuolar membrane protein n=1 Tax=Dissophora globulifera TaxID=979702 RepID=A0A9P6UYR1_9FUNG|nr:hypothetical protein BGZ99_010251 [Dissophora globulifera]